MVGIYQQFFQSFLACAAIAELADLIAQQLRGERTVQRGDGVAGLLLQRRPLRLRQVRNRRQVGVGGRGELGRGGIAVQQFEDPAGAQIADQQTQLGEGDSDQMVQMVDEARALADDGLQAAGALP